MRQLKYICQFVNPTTGERKEAIVELSAEEIADVRRQRGGGMDHPLAKMFAARRAPEGFFATVDTIHCVDPGRTH
jgi:hypothetical protein